jgi:hypothetical protein
MAVAAQDGVAFAPVSPNRRGIRLARRLMRVVVIAAMLATVAGLAPARADATFSDGTFVDWTFENAWTTGGATSVAFTSATDGNPPPYRHTTNTMPGGSTTVDAHLKLSAVYDPSVQGAIDSVDYAYDLNPFAPNFAIPAVAYGPLLKQDGRYYIAPGDLAHSLVFPNQWRHFEHPNLTEGSFRETTPAGPGGHPDFSASGSPIQFGYFTSNSTCCFGIGNSGLDNWFVHVTSEGPIGPGPPATLTLEPAADTNDLDTQHCVTATVRDAAGNPTPGITVRFSVTGSVNTSGSATTDANGEATFCYQGPELPGADVISAFADTDNDGNQDPGEPSDTATKLWTFPTSTPLCEAKVTQGGRITAANGDKATFGGNAQSDDAGNVKGQEEYQDHGPAQPQRVKSIQVLGLTCNEERTQATVFGTATINGSGMHEFRIDVQDLGEPGVGRDTYRISLSNGYDSGVQRLKGGNVQIH